jgi:tetratricopeptide (TPR) repeat protein
MGEVWLATRSDGRYEGKCAIKFLSAPVASAKLADRFRREGSFLARLAHPNIARLLDAGEAGDGQSYLALEYVDGVRIDVCCRNGNFDFKQRVRLFVEVVGAIAHAHSQLIIHRDLKPSNVLVTRDGQVKLLDFGIAKLLDTGYTEGGELTRVEDAALTPEYAAPEQLLGEPPSTATDVYQLGLLLYVLLTGKHPVPHSATRAERVRAALDSVVPRASEIADTPDRASLRGDLDAILDMALRKNPAERYSTAQAMTEDLQRYLNDEPVAARRGAAFYRARKFVRRHTFATVGTAVAAAGLVLAMLFALGQAREAARQRDVTRKELARATAVNDFATYLISTAAPGDGRFTGSELLAASEALIDKQFPADSPIKAEILATVGQQYLQSQRFDKAMPVLARAAAIASPIGDPVLNARVNCPLALLQLVVIGSAKDSVALIERTLAELPDSPEYGPLRAECLTRYSEFEFLTSDAERAIRNATAALQLFDSHPEASIARRLDAQAALAWGYYLAHETEKADQEFARIEKGLEAVGRERTLAAADNYNNWAMLHYRGNIRRAEPLMSRAVELRRFVDGSAGVSPNLTFNYAGVLLVLGRFDEAAPIYEETIRIAEERGEILVMANAAMEFADLKIQTNDLPAAAALLEKADKAASGSRAHDWTRGLLAYHRGLLAEARGDFPAARAFYLDSARLLETKQEVIALNINVYCAISRMEHAKGDDAASREAANHALALSRQLAVSDSPSYLLGKALLAVGDNQRYAGEADQSRQSFRLALENFENTLGPEHSLTKEAARKSTAADSQPTASSRASS